MRQICWLSASIWMILTFIGSGIASLYPTGEVEERVWSAPWWGICFIVLLGGVLSLANIPMKYGSYAVVGVATLFNLYVVLTRQWKPLSWPTNSSWLLLSVILLVAFYLFPMWGKVGYPTTLSLGNLDPVTYASGGEFLRNHSVIQGSKVLPEFPSTASIADLLHYGFRYGIPLLLSFFAVILRQEVYQIFTIVLAVVTALTVPLLYFLSKKLLGSHNNWLHVGAVLFFGLNSTLLYWQFHGFLPQFMYGGLLILLILMAMQKSSTKAWWAGICLAGISTVYPDGMLIALVPLLLAKTKNMKWTLAYAFALSPITMTNSFYQILRLIKVTTNTTFIGWERIRWASLGEMLGIYNLNYSRDLPWIADSLVAIPILIAILLGLFVSKNKKLLGTYLLWIGTFLFFYRFIINNFFVYNRVIGYGLFLIASLASLGFAQITNRKVSVAIMIIVGALTIRSANRTMTQYINHHRLVESEMAQLKTMPAPASAIYNSDVLLEGYDLWKRVWEEHFMRDVPFYTRANLPLVERGNGPFVILQNTPSKGYELITVDKLLLAKDLQ